MAGQYKDHCSIAERAQAYLVGWTLACLLLGALVGVGVFGMVRR